MREGPKPGKDAKAGKDLKAIKDEGKRKDKESGDKYLLLSE